LKEGIDHTLLFLGGDPQYHTKDFTKLSIENAVDFMTKWKLSLKFAPTILTTEVKLIPLSLVVKRLGQNYMQEIDNVSEILFNSTLKCILPVSKRPQTSGNASEMHWLQWQPEKIQLL